MKETPRIPISEANQQLRKLLDSDQAFASNRPNIPYVTRDSGGRVLWQLQGNTPEENEQLGIRNVQGLFLGKFSEFLELFPFGEDGKIIEEKREEAKEFIIERIGSHKKFTNSISKTATGSSSALYFGSYRLTLSKSFKPWGIDLSVTRAPEGWMTTNELAKQLRLSEGYIAGLARKNRQTHPEWFQRHYSPKGGALAEYCSSEFALLATNKYSDIVLRPEGWMTTKALSKQLKVSDPLIVNLANRHRKSKPDSFRNYRDSMGKVYEHFSPELIALIIQEYTGLTRAPEGWMNANALAKQLKASHQYTSSIANKHRESNPEWFQQHRSSNGVNEYYSPELVALIIKEYSDFTQAPEGWITADALARQLKAGHTYITNLAKKYIESNPELVRDYRILRGPVYPHYSPDLAELIIKEYSFFAKAPKGWMPHNTLLRQLKGGEKVISDLTSRYRETHPEWFQNFTSKSGRVTEHYSPEFVSITTSEILSRHAPPQGWVSNGGLARQIKISQYLVTKISHRFRKEHPEWFKNYYPKGKSYEYYSPELVALIIKEYEAFKQAPTGWMTNNELAKHLKFTFIPTANLANKYREQHPEFFHIYRNPGGQICEYYSPELIALITQEDFQLIYSPEGWMTNKALAKQLKRDSQLTARLANEYRQSHPEWFNRHRGSRGTPAEYYSPILIKEITAILETMTRRRGEREKEVIPSNEANEELRKLLEVEDE